MSTPSTKTSIFLTGSTGYIGGSVLNSLLKHQDKYAITALVRTQAAADKLTSLGVTPVIGSLDDHSVLVEASKNADVVLHTAHADHVPGIKAIAEGLLASPTFFYQGNKAAPKKKILIHTSGTGVLADRAEGNSTSDFIYNDADIATIHAIPIERLHRDVDSFIFENLSDKVTTAIVAPPTIHGLGSGPFSIISQQIPNLIRAALKVGYAGTVGKGINYWNAVHIADLADFYLLLLEKTLAGEAETGKEGGFYIPENGTYQYIDVVTKIGETLFEKKLIASPQVKELPHDFVLQHWGPDYWYISAGNSRGKGERARRLGWQPSTRDIFSSLPEEIEHILKEKK